MTKVTDLFAIFLDMHYKRSIEKKLKKTPDQRSISKTSYS